MNIFENNVYLLKKIFGEKEISEKLEHLKFIHTNTEESWCRNLKNFKNHEIKYLLICEAPPYSETENPKYFYNQFDQKFNKTIWKTFFENERYPTSSEIYYSKLAQKGFLLVDNIPFSMKYEPKHRRTKYYSEIIKNYLPETISKINDANIIFTKELKIAFGFKLNAINFIKITGGKINLKNFVFKFDEENICADGSGFPNSTKLSRIFFNKNEEQFSEYQYYRGEDENPYWDRVSIELDFLNPKSLFWYYEETFHLTKTKKDDFRNFIENLIHNKLSEYVRSDYQLWEMYFKNSIKK